MTIDFFTIVFIIAFCVFLYWGFVINPNQREKKYREIISLPSGKLVDITNGGNKVIAFINDDNRPIYFREIEGAVTLSCKNCNFSSNIVSLLKNSYGTNVAHQCQSCGTFKSLRGFFDETKGISLDDFIISESLVCYCGGELKRDKPVFCPKCKSKIMKYKVIEK